MNEVALETSPSVPVTVILKEPAGVEEDVLIVKVLAKVGLLDEGSKLHEAAGGSPLVHDRVTD